VKRGDVPGLVDVEKVKGKTGGGESLQLYGGWAHETFEKRSATKGVEAVRPSRKGH